MKYSDDYKGGFPHEHTLHSVTLDLSLGQCRCEDVSMENGHGGFISFHDHPPPPPHSKNNLIVIIVSGITIIITLLPFKSINLITDENNFESIHHQI